MCALCSGKFDPDKICCVDRAKRSMVDGMLIGLLIGILVVLFKIYVLKKRNLGRESESSELSGQKEKGSKQSSKGSKQSGNQSDPEKGSQERSGKLSRKERRALKKASKSQSTGASTGSNTTFGTATSGTGGTGGSKKTSRTLSSALRSLTHRSKKTTTFADQSSASDGDNIPTAEMWAMAADEALTYGVFFAFFAPLVTLLRVSYDILQYPK